MDEPTINLSNVEFSSNTLPIELYTNKHIKNILINTSNLNNLANLPPNILSMLIENSQLEQIDGEHIPIGISYLYVPYNNIEYLFHMSLLINLIELDLSNNTLIELTELPPNLILLNCSNNLLNKIVFVDTLQIVLLNDNCLSQIPLIPSNVIEINLSNNEFKTNPISASSDTKIINNIQTQLQTQLQTQIQPQPQYNLQSIREESIREESIREESIREESIREESIREELIREESLQDYMQRSFSLADAMQDFMPNPMQDFMPNPMQDFMPNPMQDFMPNPMQDSISYSLPDTLPYSLQVPMQNTLSDSIVDSTSTSLQNSINVRNKVKYRRSYII